MKKTVGFALAVLAGAQFAGAAVIDFESFAVGTTVSGPGVFSDLVFSRGGDRIEVIDRVPGPDLSGQRTAWGVPFTSDNEFRADFSITGVNSVSVALGDFDADADNLFIQAFNSSNVLLDTETFALPAPTFGGPTLTVTGTDIAYVIFGSSGTFNNSIFFDNFAYEAVSGVPDSGSTLALLGSALLLGIGCARRFGLACQI